MLRGITPLKKQSTRLSTSNHILLIGSVANNAV